MSEFYISKMRIKVVLIYNIILKINIYKKEIIYNEL